MGLKEYYKIFQCIRVILAGRWWLRTMPQDIELNRIMHRLSELINEYQKWNNTV